MSKPTATDWTIVDMKGGRVLASGTLWQPIGTAPKDGSKVDLWVVPEDSGHKFRVPDCYWSDDRSDWITDHGYPLKTYYGYPLETTHWMPIPKPPKDAE